MCEAAGIMMASSPGTTHPNALNMLNCWTCDFVAPNIFPHQISWVLHPAWTLLGYASQFRCAFVKVVAGNPTSYDGINAGTNVQLYDIMRIHALSTAFQLGCTSIQVSRSDRSDRPLYLWGFPHTSFHAWTGFPEQPLPFDWLWPTDWKRNPTRPLGSLSLIPTAPAVIEASYDLQGEVKGLCPKLRDGSILEVEWQLFQVKQSTNRHTVTLYNALYFWYLWICMEPELSSSLGGCTGSKYMEYEYVIYIYIYIHMYIIYIHTYT